MKALRPLGIVVSFLLLMSSAAFGQNGASPGTRPYKITSQPAASYTLLARQHGVQGSVNLEITLLASGQIGDVTVVKDYGWEKMSKYGLTEKAVAAARKIRFKPKIVQGIAMSVIIIREYTFSLY